MYHRAILADGSTVFMINEKNCTVNYGSNRLQNICGMIGIDINGFKPPNKIGVDTFYLWIAKDGIIPPGTKEETHTKLSTECNIKSTSGKTNGVACASWVITKGNMDYLRQTVNW